MEVFDLYLLLMLLLIDEITLNDHRHTLVWVSGILPQPLCSLDCDSLVIGIHKNFLILIVLTKSAGGQVAEVNQERTILLT
jgi:hypothetical protein